MWNSNANSMMKMAMRNFSTNSRKRAPNLRKINPRVSFQEAASIAEGIYGVVKSHGPLSIGTAWTHAKDAGISGLESKTHLKLMLKWMRGRNMLKQICNLSGSTKKFLLTTLHAEPQSDQPVIPREPKPKSGKTPRLNTRQAR